MKPSETLRTDRVYCTCCEAPLSGRPVELEFDQRIDKFHDFGGVPDDCSQGIFPFGPTCAKKARKEARVALKARGLWKAPDATTPADALANRIANLLNETGSGFDYAEFLDGAIVLGLEGAEFRLTIWKKGRPIRGVPAPSDREAAVLERVAELIDRDGSFEEEPTVFDGYLHLMDSTGRIFVGRVKED